MARGYMFILVFAAVGAALSSSSPEDEPATKKRPLDTYVQHYEHIVYNQERLMRGHQRVRRSNLGNQDGITLSFHAFNRNFDLLLYPDDQFIHRSASIYSSDGEVSKSHIKSFLYAGHDRNNPSITVIGNLAFGLFDGKVMDSEETYYIEPSDRYLNESVADSHSIIYRKSDVDMSKVFMNHPETTPCGATTRAQQRNLVSSMLSNTKHPNTTDAVRRSKRQSFDANRIRCHLNVIADNKFYSSLTDSSLDQDVRVAQAGALIRQFIADGSDNFKRQDFNDDGVADGIHFSLFNLTIETDPPSSDSPFSNDFLGPDAYLNAHSAADYSDYCLSYRFTYRDFAQGVLGLAYVAATGTRGGICDNVSNSKTFNTGMVTLLNYNSRVSNAVTGLTFTHEAGHNFGSQHDPDTAECQPSDSDGGKYVMFARANDGSRPNNKNFSPCSRRMMITQIETKGQNPNDDCFLTAEDDCGNSVVDPGEACDCGLNYNTTSMLCNDDPCCNGTNCRLANQAQCSPSQGECCDETCTFIGSNFICRDADECLLAQNCNGSSAVCPESEIRPSNTSIIMCLTENNKTKFCEDGACVGSICIPLGLDDCECTEEEKQCHVCCMLPSGVCESTITIADTNDTAKNLIPDGEGQVLDVGFPCDDFNGYCNFFNICQLINTEGAIKRLADSLLDSEFYRSAIDLVRQYWWGGIIAVFVIVVGMFLLVFGCDRLLPRPQHMKKRIERRSGIRKSGKVGPRGGKTRGAYDLSHAQRRGLQ